MGVKERWKKFPYWLKGALILSGIYLSILVLILVLYLIAIIIFGEGFNPGGAALTIIGILFFIIFLILSIPGWIISTIFGISGETISYWIFVVNAMISIVIYFLIGALIGWIYGKRKSKSAP